MGIRARKLTSGITWQKNYDRTLQNYRTSRLKSVKPATVNREFACLKRMLNLAVKSDDYVIRHNPLCDIKA